jgi:hypothetical protein
MKPLRMQHVPPLGLGLASVALGAVGLMLFILPILGVPISGSGLAVGLVGAIVAIARRSMDLRLSIAGVAVCLLALGVDIAINYAPADYLDPRPPPPGVAPMPPRQFVPPPAPFHGATGVKLPRNLA